MPWLGRVVDARGPSLDRDRDPDGNEKLRFAKSMSCPPSLPCRIPRKIPGKKTGKLRAILTRAAHPDPGRCHLNGSPPFGRVSNRCRPR